MRYTGDAWCCVRFRTLIDRPAPFVRLTGRFFSSARRSRAERTATPLTQGMPVLREKLQRQVDEAYGHDDRELFVTSGTSGGLLLAMMALVNPGEEVIVFDPFFVMYNALAAVVGGKVVTIDNLSRLPHRPGPGRRGDHPEDQDDPVQ